MNEKLKGKMLHYLPCMTQVVASVQMSNHSILISAICLHRISRLLESVHSQLGHVLFRMI